MACKIVICNREIKDSRRINGLVHVVKHPGKTILVAQNKVEPVAEAAQAGRGAPFPFDLHLHLIFLSYSSCASLLLSPPSPP